MPQLGIQMETDASEIGAQVTFITEGGLGEQAGFKLGDRVVSIDGEDVQKASYDMILTLLKKNFVTVEVVEDAVPEDDTTEDDDIGTVRVSVFGASRAASPADVPSMQSHAVLKTFVCTV